MRQHEVLLENIVVYIAGFVVRKVVTKIACDVCRHSLFRDHLPENKISYSLLRLKDCGGLVKPPSGTVTILIATEKIMSRLMNIGSASNICSKEAVLHTVKREYGAVDPFSLGAHISDSQHGIENHDFSLLELLVTTFYTLRQKHIAKGHTDKKKGMSVRNKLNQAFSFQGE